jgi:hypothetical protein
MRRKKPDPNQLDLYDQIPLKPPTESEPMPNPENPPKEKEPALVLEAMRLQHKVIANQLGETEELRAERTRLLNLKEKIKGELEEVTKQFKEVTKQFKAVCSQLTPASGNRLEKKLEATETWLKANDPRWEHWEDADATDEKPGSAQADDEDDWLDDDDDMTAPDDEEPSGVSNEDLTTNAEIFEKAAEAAPNGRQDRKWVLRLSVASYKHAVAILRAVTADRTLKINKNSKYPKTYHIALFPGATVTRPSPTVLYFSAPGKLKALITQLPAILSGAGYVLRGKGWIVPEGCMTCVSSRFIQSEPDRNHCRRKIVAAPGCEAYRTGKVKPGRVKKKK